jgi:4-hydroxy-tetrahydrodipicolinate reductase
MVKIVISGICGKMGKSIAVLAGNDKEFEIIGALEVEGSPCIGKYIGETIGVGNVNKKVVSGLDKIEDGFDALIEFTSPKATLVHLETAIQKRVGMVIGTTGFSAGEINSIKEASEKIPIVFSPNMSVGVNVLFKISSELAKLLGSDYEIEIVEAHHNQKKDAPSGTAKKLGEVIMQATKKMPPIHSIRAGDIVGDHTIVFAGRSERIELTHRAHSRDTFSKGALLAAKFLIGKKSGLYDMNDVINNVT